MGLLGQLRDELYIAEAELAQFDVATAFRAIPYDSATAQPSPWTSATASAPSAAPPASPQRVAVGPARELVAARRPAVRGEAAAARPVGNAERLHDGLASHAPGERPEDSSLFTFQLDVPVGFRFNLLRILRPVVKAAAGALGTALGVSVNTARDSLHTRRSSMEQPDSPPPASATEGVDVLVACDLHSPARDLDERLALDEMLLNSASATATDALTRVTRLEANEKTLALERAARLAQLERESHLESRLLQVERIVASPQGSASGPNRFQSGGRNTPPGLSPVREDRGHALANLALSHYGSGKSLDEFEFASSPAAGGSVYPASPSPRGRAASSGSSGSSNRRGGGAFGSPDNWLTESLYSSRRS